MGHCETSLPRKNKECDGIYNLLWIHIFFYEFTRKKNK